MRLIVYYEGSDAIKTWVQTLVGEPCDFRKLPTSNYSKEFARLPSFVADILYLDKPDIIISGAPDGIHERPLMSIELAACTPQYQHAIQRFSRMLASVANGCPSVLIMPKTKAENLGGGRVYHRSAAADYGAVRLTDVYRVPAIVLDWPDTAGTLDLEGSDTLPKLASPSMLALGSYLREAITAFFGSVDYIGALARLSSYQLMIDQTRAQAYAIAPPTISNPGGGSADNSGAKLDLVDTSALLDRLKSEGRITPQAINQLPAYFHGREKSLLFYPTRVVEHSGDPYVGMLTYYDIAFCRTGPSRRDRRYNLVAYCRGVQRAETYDVMKTFNNTKCPFNLPLTDDNLLMYSYHLKDGCAKTKTKPVRIYSEIADLTAYTDGVLVSP